jgi:hypothetical protein
MKDIIQKYRSDPYIEKMAIYTTRAIVAVLCFTAITAALVIMGTLFGELVWILIPPSK